MMTEPILTIDVNAFQALGRHETFATRGQYVISDVMLRELFAKPRDDLVSRFWFWAERHRKRLWIGQYWQDISLNEKPTTTGTDWKIAINNFWTDRLRRAVSSGDTGLLNNVSWLRESSRCDDYEQDRVTFVKQCDEFTIWMDQNRPEWRKKMGSEAERLVFIREPEIVVELALAGSPRMSASPGVWRAALAKFPDELAIGRWARIIIWYMVQRSIGATKDFENNWDDAHHAHLASYTGAIITRDKRLIRLLNAVFPHVQIYED